MLARRGNILIISSLCVVSLLGCQKPEEQVVEFITLPAAPHGPMLVSGRDAQISLFGELPNVPGSDFESRAAVSLRQHSYPTDGSDFDPSISSEGQMMVFSSTRHSHTPDIYIKDVDGMAVTQLTSDPSSDIQPAISPDGRRVAFASDRGGNWDIWVVNIDGQQPIQVTANPAHEVHPSWSPDGSDLVFSSLPERGGQWELWTASAEAGAVKKFIGYGLFPEWSPSSDTVVFQRARRRGSRWFSLWTIQLINGEPRMPTEICSSAAHAMILPTWSPDGSQIAFCSVASAESLREDGRGEFQRADVWMVDADGRGRVRLTEGTGANYAPAWSKLGRIYFTSDRGDETTEAVWSVIPLRAPLTAQARPTNDAYSRSHEERADEVIGDQARRRLETVGWPSKGRRVQQQQDEIPQGR